MQTDEPCTITLEPGTHYICQCGQSMNRPFCDGSHAGTGKQPHALEITEPGDVTLCGCLQSQNPPYCDGSHLKTR